MDKSIHPNEIKKEQDVAPQPVILSVEDMVEQKIGDINWMQIWQIFLVSLASLFDTQQCFISVFADALPPWHCNGTSSSSCLTNKSNLCDLPRSGWAWNSGNATHTSTVSEWDLECASSFIAGLPTTCFFLGCLLGGFFLPTLGDSYLGRKKLLCLCSLIMCLGSLSCAFSPNLWVYALFRFVSGIGRGPITVCVLVLLTEKIGKRWRSEAILAGFSTLSFGPLSMTVIAYLTRNLSWRILYLATSVPGLIGTILYYFFLYESPRWLFMQGRTKDAVKVLNNLRRSEKNSQIDFPQNLVYPKPEVLPTSSNLLSSLKTLGSRSWAVKRLLAVVVPTFGIGILDFGLLLGVQNLGYNIYVTTVLNGTLSLITSFLTCLWWIPKYNRKSSMLGFSTVGGITCILLAIISRRNIIGVVLMQLVSLFCAYMAGNLVFVYVVELFPTCVRNSASSVVKLAMILGSVFVPTLNLLGRKNRFYSYGVFGIVMFLSGFLILYLPETKGKVMCDTMDEQEVRDGK